MQSETFQAFGGRRGRQGFSRTRMPHNWLMPSILKPVMSVGFANSLANSIWSRYGFVQDPYLGMLQLVFRNGMPETAESDESSSVYLNVLELHVQLEWLKQAVRGHRQPSPETIGGIRYILADRSRDERLRRSSSSPNGQTERQVYDQRMLPGPFGTEPIVIRYDSVVNADGSESGDGMHTDEHFGVEQERWLGSTQSHLIAVLQRTMQATMFNQSADFVREKLEERLELVRHVIAKGDPLTQLWSEEQTTNSNVWEDSRISGDTLSFGQTLPLDTIRFATEDNGSEKPFLNFLRAATFSQWMHILQSERSSSDMLAASRPLASTLPTIWNPTLSIWSNRGATRIHSDLQTDLDLGETGPSIVFHNRDGMDHSSELDSYVFYNQAFLAENERLTLIQQSMGKWLPQLQLNGTESLYRTLRSYSIWRQTANRASRFQTLQMAEVEHTLQTVNRMAEQLFLPGLGQTELFMQARQTNKLIAEDTYTVQPLLLKSLDFLSRVEEFFSTRDNASYTETNRIVSDLLRLNQLVSRVGLRENNREIERATSQETFGSDLIWMNRQIPFTDWMMRTVQQALMERTMAESYSLSETSNFERNAYLSETDKRLLHNLREIEAGEKFHSFRSQPLGVSERIMRTFDMWLHASHLSRNVPEAAVRSADALQLKSVLQTLDATQLSFMLRSVDTSQLRSVLRSVNSLRSGYTVETPEAVLRSESAAITYDVLPNSNAQSVQMEFIEGGNRRGSMFSSYGMLPSEMASNPADALVLQLLYPSIASNLQFFDLEKIVQINDPVSMWQQLTERFNPLNVLSFQGSSLELIRNLESEIETQLFEQNLAYTELPLNFRWFGDGGQLSTASHAFFMRDGQLIQELRKSNFKDVNMFLDRSQLMNNINRTNQYAANPGLSLAQRLLRSFTVWLKTVERLTDLASLQTVKSSWIPADEVQAIVNKLAIFNGDVEGLNLFEQLTLHPIQRVQMLNGMFEDGLRETSTSGLLERQLESDGDGNWFYPLYQEYAVRRWSQASPQQLSQLLEVLQSHQTSDLKTTSHLQKEIAQMIASTFTQTNVKQRVVDGTKATPTRMQSFFPETVKLGLRPYLVNSVRLDKTNSVIEQHRNMSFDDSPISSSPEIRFVLSNGRLHRFVNDLEREQRQKLDSQQKTQASSSLSTVHNFVSKLFEQIKTTSSHNNLFLEKGSALAARRAVSTKIADRYHLNQARMVGIYPVSGQLNDLNDTEFAGSSVLTVSSITSRIERLLRDSNNTAAINETKGPQQVLPRLQRPTALTLDSSRQDDRLHQRLLNRLSTGFIGSSVGAMSQFFQTLRKLRTVNDFHSVDDNARLGAFNTLDYENRLERDSSESAIYRSASTSMHFLDRTEANTNTNVLSNTFNQLNAPDLAYRRETKPSEPAQDDASESSFPQTALKDALNMAEEITNRPTDPLSEIDYDRLVNRIYNELEDRLELDRQRRGL